MCGDRRDNTSGQKCRNQPDALIIQIYSVIQLYMFRASSLPIIRMTTWKRSLNLFQH